MKPVKGRDVNLLGVEELRQVEERGRRRTVDVTSCRASHEHGRVGSEAIQSDVRSQENAERREISSTPGEKICGRGLRHRDRFPPPQHPASQHARFAPLPPSTQPQPDVTEVDGEAEKLEEKSDKKAKRRAEEREGRVSDPPDKGW